MMDGKRRIARAAGVLAILGCVMFGAQAQETVAPGSLGGHWPMDTFTAPTTPDVSGNTNTATATGTPVVVPGVFGNALQFNGTQFLSIPDSASLNVGSGDFTVGLWINPTNMTALNRVFNKWSTVGNGSGILLDINATAGGGFLAGNLRFRISDGTTNLDYVTPAYITGNIWQHIAGTVNRTTRELKIYVNGVQVGATQPIAVAMGSIGVADEIQVAELNGATRYSGSIDELVFYNRALTQPEIAGLVAGTYVNIGATNPGPVVAQPGLLARYYNNNANITGAISPPGSAAATPSTTATQALMRVDAVNYNYDTSIPPGVNGDHFFGVWTGKILSTAAAGDYLFGTNADDGTRIWVNGIQVLDHWVGQGAPGVGNPNMGTPVTLAANTLYDIRVEFMEMTGNASIQLYWTPFGAGGPTVVPVLNMFPPDGPSTPANLTATGSTGSATPQVVVTWNASTPITASNYVLSRATAPGGPFTQIAVQAGTTYTDTGVSFGTAYYYMVQGTDQNNLQVGAPTAASAGATPIQPAVAVSGGPVTTSENGSTATLTLTVIKSPSADGSITITSTNANQAIVSGAGTDAVLQGPAGSITIPIVSGTPASTTFTITVQGVEDFYDNGDQPYQIQFTVNGGGAAWSTGNTISPVNGTNLDIDTANLLVNPTGGLFTDTNGATAQFAVRLNTIPLSGGVVTVNLTSSNPTEGTVSPAMIQFTAANWNVGQTVTLTGQGTNVTYQNANYTVTVAVTSTTESPTASYTTSMVVAVSALNIHQEVPPELKHVWGGSSSGGGGGGCGLTGLDAVLLLGLLAVRRRGIRRN